MSDKESYMEYVKNTNNPIIIKITPFKKSECGAGERAPQVKGKCASARTRLRIPRSHLKPSGRGDLQ